MLQVAAAATKANVSSLQNRNGASATYITEAFCALIELWLQTDLKSLRSHVKSVNDTLVKMMLNGPSPRLTAMQELLQSRFSGTD